MTFLADEPAFTEEDTKPYVIAPQESVNERGLDIVYLREWRKERCIAMKRGAIADMLIRYRGWRAISREEYERHKNERNKSEWWGKRMKRPLTSVERLALYVIGQLAIDGTLPRSVVEEESFSLYDLYRETTNALENGLQFCDREEINNIIED